jgi:hypothetical protein
MNKRRGWAGTAMAVAAVGLWLSPSAIMADETLLCNFVIKSLPYTVAVPGHYCFVGNLLTPMTSGNAITINADAVVLDLNNFILAGDPAGPGTLTNGIYAEGHKYITIRNGHIRGFYTGINLTAVVTGSSAGHLVENNRVEHNTFIGIVVVGGRSVVRNNVIGATGGSTLPGVQDAVAISGSTNEGSLTVQDNVVSGLTAPSSVQGVGLCTFGGGVGVVSGNSISGLSANGTNGVMDACGTSYCRDNTVTAPASMPYFGCQMIANNYP